MEPGRAQQYFQGVRAAMYAGRAGMTGTWLTAADVIGSFKAEVLVELKAFLQTKSDPDTGGGNQSSDMDILLPIAEYVARLTPLPGSV